MYEDIPIPRDVLLSVLAVAPVSALPLMVFVCRN